MSTLTYCHHYKTVRGQSVERVTQQASDWSGFDCVFKDAHRRREEARGMYGGGGGGGAGGGVTEGGGGDGGGRGGVGARKGGADLFHVRSRIDRSALSGN